MLGTKNNISEQTKMDEQSVRESGDEETDVSIAFEKALDMAGSWGIWQKIMFVVISINQIFTAMHIVSAVFVSATPDFKCQVSELVFDPHNISGVLENLSIPYTSECHFYQHNYSAINNEIELSSFITYEDLLPFLSNVTESCEIWDYDSSVYTLTAVTEWDLVCSRKWLKSSVQSTFFAGILIGSIFYGHVADKFGRRTTILFSCVCLIISSIGTAFSFDYGSFLALRFIVALNCAGLMVTQFVLLMEIVKAEARTLVGMLNGATFGMGVAQVAIFAYFIRSWRALHISLGGSTCLLLVYFFILPESPRWLVLKGRSDEALQLLKKIAKFNKKDLPQDQEIMMLLNKSSRKDSVSAKMSLTEKIVKVFNDQLLLVKTPNMRRRSLVCSFVWFASAMIYYGLIFYSATITSDPFAAVVISGYIEIPAFGITVVALYKFGRRKITCALFLLSSISLIVLSLVPKDYNYLMFFLASLGKMFDTAVFQLAYLYNSELVPTEVRNIAVGAGSMFARVGAAAAPFIIDFLSEIHYSVPTIVFSVVALLAGLSSLLLPETMDKPLPQTIEEVERKKR